MSFNKSARNFSISDLPSISDPIPKLILIIQGSSLSLEILSAYKYAFFMLSVTDAPPEYRLLPNLQLITYAPGAMPLRPVPPISFPAAIPAT